MGPINLGAVVAKLYFYYSAMNAGKSTTLLQSSHNYNERGMDTLLFVPKIDVRYGAGVVSSRIGLAAEAIQFGKKFNFLPYIRQQLEKNSNLRCILVDEAQFLTRAQVVELVDVVDNLGLPVLTYGLRSDFLGDPFEGSMYLLVWSDTLTEIKTICHCGRKAMMNQRIDEQGMPVKEGAQIEVGGNDRYVALCRKHFSWPVEQLSFLEQPALAEEME